VAELAFGVDGTVVRFDDDAGLEEADAEAGFFGTFEGTKEGIFEESGGDAGAGVGDGEADCLILGGGLDMDGAWGGDRI
jgi:hypothetical protein